MVKRLGDVAQYSHNTFFLKEFNNQNCITCF
jgi:hypothetical protein